MLRKLSGAILRCSWFFIYIGALSFLRLEEEYWRSSFLINFIGVNFEAGNQRVKKVWSDSVAEQIEE